MRRRDKVVGPAELDPRRHADRGHVEAPRLDESEHVVDPAVHAGRESVERAGRPRLTGVSPFAPSRPRTAHRCRPGSRPGRQPGDQASSSRSRSAIARIGFSPSIAAVNSSMLPWVMPSSQSRPFGRIRSDGNLREAANDAVGHQRGRCQAVWAAARATRDDEPVDPERVSNGFDVADHICDRAALMPRGLAVTGPVIGDPAQSMALVDGGVFPVRDAPARRAVHCDQRQTVRVAPLSNGQSPAVRCLGCGARDARAC